MDDREWARGNEYTVLLVDPDVGFRSRWQWILEKAGCHVVAAPSLEAILDFHKSGADLLVAASTAIDSESELLWLENMRKERNDMPVLALAQGDDLKRLMSIDAVTDVIPYPPVRDFLVKKVQQYREQRDNSAIVAAVAPNVDFIIRQMKADLKKKNVNGCMTKAYFLCTQLPDDERVLKALFDVLHTSIEENIDVPGLELHAVSTDAFYSAHGHPPLMRTFNGCFKRYLEKRRAICDLVSLKELERRKRNSEKEVSEEMNLLRSKQTVVKTVGLKLPKLLHRPNTTAKDQEIYVYMEYVRGPTMNNIAAEVREQLDKGDPFAQKLTRAVRYITNEWLAALQAIPIHMPSSVRLKKQEYYHSIRKMFAEGFAQLASQMSPDDHLALRRAIKSFLGPLNRYSPVQYFDMCAKNLMFKIDGAFDSKFDDVKSHFQRTTGHDPSSASFKDVFNYLRNSALAKVDWNKTYRLVHSADDARHESPHLPIAMNDSRVLDLHMIVIKEKEKLIEQQMKKARSSKKPVLASRSFQKAYSNIERLDNLAFRLASGETDFEHGIEEASGLLPSKTVSGFGEYNAAVIAAWLYRAMRTFKLTKLEYLPEDRNLRDKARKRMTECYVSQRVKAELEKGKKEWELEDRIVTIIKRVDKPDRRPYVGGDIFVPEPVGDASKFIKEGMLEAYVNATNMYLKSYANARELHNELVFCLHRIRDILDYVIANGAPANTPAGVVKQLHVVADSSEAYCSTMRNFERKYRDHRFNQYAGAMYLRRFLDKFAGKAQREYHAGLREAAR